MEFGFSEAFHCSRRFAAEYLLGGQDQATAKEWPRDVR